MDVSEVKTIGNKEGGRADPHWASTELWVWALNGSWITKTLVKFCIWRNMNISKQHIVLKIQLCNFAWNAAVSIFSSRRLCLRRGDVVKNKQHQKISLFAVCATTGLYKSVEVWSLLTALQMPHSWVAAVNIGSIIKGLSLPCSPSSLHSANACICNVPEAALSPPATWIRCQPPVHGKALIWRQASRVPRWAAEKSDVLPPVLISSTHTQLASSSPAALQHTPTVGTNARHFSRLPCAFPACRLPIQSPAATVLRLEFITTAAAYTQVQNKCDRKVKPCFPERLSQLWSGFATVGCFQFAIFHVIYVLNHHSFFFYN